MSDQPDLRILRVEPGEEIAGARKLLIDTTRGPIRAIVHGAETPSRAALCISGAVGGFDGPALLYPRLGLELPGQGITVARMNYRTPNNFRECLLDVMAGLAFLNGTGHTRTAVLGHSFGGAVAIAAGAIAPEVTTVVGLSSQIAGAEPVGRIAPRPLLLIHGTKDDILPDQCSKMIFERAGEPKTLKLFEGAGHRLAEVGEELFQTVSAWLLEKA